MNINITGDGLALTDALQAYVNEKFAKLERYRDYITQISVVLSTENKRQKAEATIMIPHSQDINATATTDDLYISIDELADKVERQYLKVKDKAITAQRSKEKLMIEEEII